MNRLSLLAMSASLVLSSLSAVSRGFVSVLAEGSEVSISTSDVVVDLAALYPEKSLSELLPDADNPYDGKFGVVGLAPVVDGDGLYRDVYLYLAVSLDYSASAQGISEVGYYYDQEHTRVYTIVPEGIQDGWAYQWGGFEFLKVRLLGADLGYQIYGGQVQYFGLDHVRIGGTPFYCSEEVYWQDGQGGADPVFEFYKTDYVDVSIKVGLNLEGYDDPNIDYDVSNDRYESFHEQVWGFANLGKSDHDITQLISVSGYYQYVPYDLWWRVGFGGGLLPGCYTGILSEDSFYQFVNEVDEWRWGSLYSYEHGFDELKPVRAKFNALESESTTMESVKWSIFGGLVSSHYVHSYKHVYDLKDYSALADSDPTLSSFFDAHSDGYDFAFLVSDSNNRSMSSCENSFNNPWDFFAAVKKLTFRCNDYQNVKVVTMGFIENDQEIQLKAVQDKWVSNSFTYVGPITDDYVVVSIPWASQAANWLSEMWSAIAPYLKIAGFALIGVAILAVGWKLAKWSSKQGKKR